MKVLWILYLISGNAVQLSEYTKEADCVQAMNHAYENQKSTSYSSRHFLCVPVMLQTEAGEP